MLQLYLKYFYFFPKNLTASVFQSLSWTVDICSAGRWILSLAVETEGLLLFARGLPLLNPILIQFYAVHIIITSISNIHFNISISFQPYIPSDIFPSDRLAFYLWHAYEPPIVRGQLIRQILHLVWDKTALFAFTRWLPEFKYVNHLTSCCRYRPRSMKIGRNCRWL
jgi:hypothetical protein